MVPGRHHPEMKTGVVQRMTSEASSSACRLTTGDASAKRSVAALDHILGQRSALPGRAAGSTDVGDFRSRVPWDWHHRQQSGLVETIAFRYLRPVR